MRPTTTTLLVLMLLQINGFPADLSAGRIFRSADEQSSIKIIGEDELELTRQLDGPHWVCKYSRDNDSLRVVATVQGSPEALYFKVTGEGLQGAGGVILYDSEHFEAASLAAKKAAKERERQRLAAQATPAPSPSVASDPGGLVAVYGPRPEYPYEARRQNLMGSGVVLMTVDVASGTVIDATMAQSTGSPVLDNASVTKFRQWRFKPGAPGAAQVRKAIHFSSSGVSY